jgi:hypothetical protein
MTALSLSTSGDVAANSTVAVDNSQVISAAQTDDDPGTAASWSKAPISWARFRSAQIHNAGVLARPLPLSLALG